MNWKPELDELARREAFAKQMGGTDKVKRQHDQGRLTVRERIDKLVDQASFHEMGTVAGIGEYDDAGELKMLTPANCVFGRGKIEGRAVVVVGDDFTVRGGSADASIAAKPIMAERMAHDFRLPIVRVIEGSGGGGSVKTIETKGAANLPGGIGGNEWYWYTTSNLAQVPVVGLGLGSVAGLGAARLAASHYCVMTKSSAMFVAGPPVVAALGQKLDKQELGGWQIQTRAGGVDDAVETEEEAFECARRFLSYLPPSVFELPPTTACDDDPLRADEALLNVVPRSRKQVYKMRPIIESVVDKGSFFEMSANFGRSIIAGFARFEGRAVMLLASDPFIYGGSWTAEACQKVVRYVDLAETFHLPIVYLMDCPGFMIGLDAEKAATEGLSMGHEGRLRAQLQILQGDIANGHGDALAKAGDPNAAKAEWQKSAGSYVVISQIFVDPEITPEALSKAVAVLEKMGDAAKAEALRKQLTSKYPDYKSK